MKFAVFCVIFILSAGSISSEVFVVGPRSISFKENLQLYLINTVKSTDHLQITVEGKSGDTFYMKSDDGSDTVELDFDQKMIEIDGMDEHTKFEDFTLHFEIANRNVKKSIGISTILRKYSAIVQSDRNIYKPGDVIKFRALVLDSETKPYQLSSTESFNLSITDADGSVVFAESGGRLTSPFKGVYVGEYKTISSQSRGSWKIGAKLGEAAEAVKMIEVTERSLPRFRVIVDGPSHVLLNGENLKIVVHGEYSFGEFVEGQVKVTVKALEGFGTETVKTRRLEQLTAKRTFEFTLRDELDLDTSCDLFIDVEIQEKISGKIVSTRTKVIVHETTKHNIELVQLGKTVKPGGSVAVRAIVKKYDDTIEQNRGSKLKFKIKSPTSDTVVEKNLVDGIANLIVESPLSTSGLTITAEYLQASSSIVIKKVDVTGKHLAVRIDNQNPKVGDTINIRVDSSEPISTIYTAMSMKTKTTYAKKSMTASKIFSFSVKVTEDMTPSFDFVAYYNAESGKVIFDSLMVEVLQQLTKPKIEFNKMQVKPLDISTITVETSPGAFIGMAAIDSSVADLNNKHDMFELLFGSQKSNELTTKSLGFGNSNFFLLKSSVTTASRFDDYDDDSTPIVSANSPPKDDKETKVQKTWFFDSIVVDGSGKSTLTKTVPNEITSWTLTGFSLDENQGIAIADPRKLYVKKDFFIKLTAPRSVRMGEYVKLEVFVYNYLPSGKSSTVTVTMARPEEKVSTSDDFDDYEHFEEKKKVVSKLSDFDIVERRDKCNFKKIQSNKTSKTLTSNPNVASSTFFFVKPKTAGDMKLVISAVSPEATDEIETTILVEYEGITDVLDKSFILEPSKGKNGNILYEITIPDDVDQNTVKIGGSLHYKLLGRTLLNVDKLMYTATYSDKDKLKSFASTVVAAKYLQAVQQYHEPQKKKAEDETRNGHEQVLEMKKFDNSFQLSRYDSKFDNIWLTAFVAKLLRMAGTAGIDSDTIEGALLFLQSKQEADGSFGVESESSKEVRGGVASKMSLTAFVMISFLENRDSDDEFKETIRKGIAYIDGNTIKILNNYEQAIATYALSLAGHKNANDFLKNLKGNAETEDDKMHWKRNFDGSGKDGEFLDLVVNIETSAYALLACIKQNDLLVALNILNWLNSQKTSNGFFSVQDTTIGIQAIAEVSKLFYHPGIGMTLNLSYETGHKHFEVATDSILSKKIFELPPKARKFHIDVDGDGKALLNIWHSYRTDLRVSSAPYRMDITISGPRYGGYFTFKACLESDAMHKMRLDVSLPEGYIYNHGSTERLKDDGVRKVVAHLESRTVTLTFSKSDINLVCIDFDVNRKKRVENTKFSSVKFFKIDNATEQTIKFYSVKGLQQCNI